MTETKTPRTPAQILETGAAWVTEGELESLVTALTAAQEELALAEAGMTQDMHTIASYEKEIEAERTARLQAKHERAGMLEKLIAAQEELAREKELRGMQLVGISTVSMQNTEESVTYRIERSNPYWTEAYGDVCAAIDREITERAARLQADHERDGMLEKLRAERAAREELEKDNKLLKGLHDLGWATQDCPVCGASFAGADQVAALAKQEKPHG